MIVYIKLPLIHCYHIFSDFMDVYLSKDYHVHYSLIWYQPTMLAYGLYITLERLFTLLLLMCVATKKHAEIKELLQVKD